MLLDNSDNGATNHAGVQRTLHFIQEMHIIGRGYAVFEGPLGGPFGAFWGRLELSGPRHPSRNGLVAFDLFWISSAHLGPMCL